ncbi:thiamine transport system ATP-binding protein [Rhizobium sp. RU20A]|uniref:thiamine ABC transporter ATP-binding protein n=1 Tax=Rhizobium sp. RU20A TaxID=1907412 RepID=UPI000954F6C1|nr:ATP-binding cassette domain-containing protein [Rhizobium sp. RU20A]SIR39911.1 thiamine transport system ATP-binding protein [Rhizobium sp. RU20A]
MTATEEAIRLEAVRLAFGSVEMRFDVGFAAGRVTGIIGPSGSGKSTLLHLIAGFEMPDSGVIRLLGRDVTADGPGMRPVSVIFQDNNLFAHLDVATNVGLGIDPALKLDAAGRAAVGDALAKVGLRGFEKRRPPTLSGGERQRVALARALVRRRPILLLDEPFAALDPERRAEMGDLVTALQRETGMTVLLVTHQPDDVVRLCDAVVEIEAGMVRAVRTLR